MLEGKAYLKFLVAQSIVLGWNLGERFWLEACSGCTTGLEFKFVNCQQIRQAQTQTVIVQVTIGTGDFTGEKLQA